MKTVKIILGIIIIFSIIFFSTGLIIKETKYITQINIEKPIEEVFIAFEDPIKLKTWMPEIKLIEPIEIKPGKVGSTYAMVVESQGEEIKMTEKILAYIVNEKITFIFDSKDMIKTDDFTFISKGDTTTIQQMSTIKSKTYMLGCMFPYFKSVLRDVSQEYLNRFKQLIEKQ